MRLGLVMHILVNFLNNMHIPDWHNTMMSKIVHAETHPRLQQGPTTSMKHNTYEVWNEWHGKYSKSQLPEEKRIGPTFTKPIVLFRLFPARFDSNKNHCSHFVSPGVVCSRLYRNDSFSSPILDKFFLICNVFLLVFPPRNNLFCAFVKRNCWLRNNANMFHGGAHRHNNFKAILNHWVLV